MSVIILSISHLVYVDHFRCDHLNAVAVLYVFAYHVLLLVGCWMFHANF